MIMIYKLVKIGNSVGVTIPKKLLNLLDLEQGEEVFIETDLKTKSIIIRSISEARNEVNPKAIKGLQHFTKRYSKAIKNLAKK